MSINPFDLSEEVCILALNLIFGNDPKIGNAIIESLGSAKSFFSLDKKQIKSLFPYGSRYPLLINEGLLLNASSLLDNLKKHNVEILNTKGVIYPASLLEFKDRPICLFTKGNHGFLDKNGKVFISLCTNQIMGRSAQRNIKDLLNTLSIWKDKTTVICTLEQECSAFIIENCLKSEFPIIGILDKPIETLWQGSISDSTRRIINTNLGAVISDYSTLSHVKYPGRSNRIIAGMSDAVVTFECSYKSNNMDICRIAFSYGKEIYAYPGRIADEESNGCNYLISKNIAQCLYSNDYLLNELTHLFPTVE